MSITISKYTSGRMVIVCPHCRESVTVGHMSWSALSCDCGRMVRKENWLKGSFFKEAAK